MGIMNPRDENDIIQQFKDGDPSQFGWIVQKYQDRTYNLCRRLLGNLQDAGDATQDPPLYGIEMPPANLIDISDKKKGEFNIPTASFSLYGGLTNQTGKLFVFDW